MKKKERKEWSNDWRFLLSIFFIEFFILNLQSICVFLCFKLLDVLNILKVIFFNISNLLLYDDDDDDDDDDLKRRNKN